MKIRLALFYLLLCLTGLAQETFKATQIRGHVVDAESGQPLAGATVQLLESDLTLLVQTDSLGLFIMDEVPVGRIKLLITFVGYQPVESDYILVNVAKIPDLSFSMLRGVDTGTEVIVKARQYPKAPVNRLLVVSARSFSAEETQRYAASVNDPSRMALSFAGVQATRDARSDIVIRGNNPMGMLWRLEGVDIPNPNHFARRGSSGGGITMFSTALLDNSDFSTGGFAAEYGDALSGVFDMHFRKGNMQEAEFTAKASLIGLDFAAEGPLAKGRSSYLVNYRYSTLGLLNSVGLNLVGERENNNFTDLAFNFNFDSKSGKSTVNFWGIGGYSKETYDPVADTADWEQYDDYAIYDFRTRMAAIGIGHRLRLGKNSQLQSSLAWNGQQITMTDDTLNRQFVPTTVNDELTNNRRITLSTRLSSRLSEAWSVKTGFFVSRIAYDFQQEKFDYQSLKLEQVIDGTGATWQLQPFVQFSWRPGPKLSINPGVHVLHLTLNGKTTVEPRLSLQYRASPKDVLSLSWGLYGKTLPLGSYFYRNPANNTTPNLNLDHMRSQHLIAGYSRRLSDAWRVQAEVYWQRMSRIPISTEPGSTWYLLNQIDGFADRPLESKGKGRQIGLDLQVERFFSKGWFLLGSFSIFDAKYTDISGNTHNTLFNSGQAGSLTLTREIAVRKSGVWQLGGKAVYNGGFWLTPLLPGANNNSREPILDESNPFSEQVPDYFRVDGRISYRKNKAGRSWQLAIDIQNMFGITNTDGLSRRYDPSVNAWIYRQQSGLVPVLSYQIDF